MDTPSPRLRKLSDDVAEKRSALRLVRPFADHFEDWNHRAALHTAAVRSSITDKAQKTAAVSALKALRSEVEEQFAEFLKVASSSSNSRVDDVRHAFNRLTSALDEALR